MGNNQNNHRLRRWLERIQPSETLLLMSIAMIVGLFTAAGVWVFKSLIALFTHIFFINLAPVFEHIGHWTIAFIPVFGGLLVGVFLHFFVGHEQYHGVSGIIESVTFAAGRLRYWRIPAKTLAAALSIGSGASVGPEDPSVQIGANIGSMIGQRLSFSDERMRSLVAAGAASGIAAAFNAPIAGVFFALEVILGEIGGAAMGVVVLAAVISAVFTQAVSGAHPAFNVASYAFKSIWELPLYILLGLFTGLIAVQYIKLIDGFHRLFDHLLLPTWAKPAIAGILVGLVGISLPQIFGVGYETIDHIFNAAPFPLALLIVLMVAKLILTPICVGSGFPGGVFAPALFIGATLGSAFGELAMRIFPQLGIVPAAMAMVGMAALLAGAVHAPLTATLLLFEMTNDYRIILPLMLTVMVSYLVSQQLQHESVYMLPIARKGLRIQRGRDVDLLETISVSQVMKPDITPLHESDSIRFAAEQLSHQRAHGLPVLDDNDHLVGILALQDIEDASLNNPDAKTVGEICTRQMILTYPDETVGAALRKMSVRDIGRLPVVERNNPQHLLGVARRSDLIRAYEIALAQRTTLHHRAQQARIGGMADVRVEEFRIEPKSICEGKPLSKIPWPRESVVSSIRRNRRLLIPHGDTVLRAGDILVVVLEDEAEQIIRQLCQTQESPSTSTESNQ